MACPSSSSGHGPRGYAPYLHLSNILLIVYLVVGWFLGHAHKGRKFTHNIHATFAPFILFLFIGQVVFGLYLKLHLERGFNKYIRRVAVLCHGTIGKITPIVSWVQMGFGGITLLGFCREDHLGQVRSQLIAWC